LRKELKREWSRPRTNNTAPTNNTNNNNKAEQQETTESEDDATEDKQTKSNVITSAHTITARRLMGLRDL
jgi:hypothetical protein